ncbi:alpha/beta fold hydrolase [Microbacterium aurum]
MTVMTVAGGDVEFATYGAHDGEPVVVHHGLFGSTGFDPGWEKITNDAGCTVLTVARPGYGRSTRAR